MIIPSPLFPHLPPLLLAQLLLPLIPPQLPLLQLQLLPLLQLQLPLLPPEEPEELSLEELPLLLPPLLSLPQLLPLLPHHIIFVIKNVSIIVVAISLQRSGVDL